MKFPLIKILMAATFLLAFPVQVLAQDEDPPALASLWVLHPKEGQAAAFEAAISEHLAFRAEQSDPRDWQGFNVAAGGDLNAVGFRYCCFKWAEQDAYDQWSIDSGAGEHYENTVAGLVGEVEHYFTRNDYANSNWPEGSGPYSLYGVTVWTPKPGTAADRSAAMAKFTSVALENGWDQVWSWNWRVGGPAELALVIPYTNWADMEPPEQSFFEFMSEHLGAEEAAATFQKFSNSFWDSEYTIYRHRPDLSMGGDD